MILISKFLNPHPGGIFAWKGVGCRFDLDFGACSGQTGSHNILEKQPFNPLDVILEHARATNKGASTSLWQDVGRTDEKWKA